MGTAKDTHTGVPVKVFLHTTEPEVDLVGYSFEGDNVNRHLSKEDIGKMVDGDANFWADFKKSLLASRRSAS